MGWVGGFGWVCLLLVLFVDRGWILGVLTGLCGLRCLGVCCFVWVVCFVCFVCLFGGGLCCVV